jgi:hypothetical protein
MLRRFQFSLRVASPPQSPQHYFLKSNRWRDPGSDNKKSGSCSNLFSPDHLRSRDIVLRRCSRRGSGRLSSFPHPHLLRKPRTSLKESAQEHQKFHCRPRLLHPRVEPLRQRSSVQPNSCHFHPSGSLLTLASRTILPAASMTQTHDSSKDTSIPA